MINIRFSLKNFKKRIKCLYLINVIIYIIIFFIFFNVSFQKNSKKKNINFIKNNEEREIIPPKPKEKWKYVKRLKNIVFKNELN